jgi:hypothetical protein
MIQIFINRFNFKESLTSLGKKTNVIASSPKLYARCESLVLLIHASQACCQAANNHLSLKQQREE